MLKMERRELNVLDAGNSFPGPLLRDLMKSARVTQCNCQLIFCLLARQYA